MFRVGTMTDPRPAPSKPVAAPAVLADAPGYQARRLYQAYLAAWVKTVDSTLTGPQFAVLTTVDSAPGNDQSSMASAVALDTSTMADIARRLEHRGLLERRTAPDDGRRKLLYLTEEGVRVLREANDRARTLDEQLFGSYAGNERIELLRQLTTLADRWEKLRED